MKLWLLRQTPDLIQIATNENLNVDTRGSHRSKPTIGIAMQESRVDRGQFSVGILFHMDIHVLFLANLSLAIAQRVYTISVTNLAGPPPTRPAPGKPECHPLMPHPLPTDPSTLAAPSFYITGRQPLRPEAILLAIVVAVGALSLVLYAMSHAGHAHFTSGGSGADRSAGASLGGAPADAQKDDDDPDQIDTVVLGDPTDAPVPARRGDHVSTVHPTILVRLPRSGEQVGFIPDTRAGHLLYNWLAAFNQGSYPALAAALPNVALGSVTAAQMELRRQTGGFSLLSAKEVQPGVLVFRLRDQTPLRTEVLGTLQVRPNSSPATIVSFSLRAVPSPPPRAAPLSPASAALESKSRRE